MPAVQSSFTIECKQGFWARFNKVERSDIIATVYRLNRAIYDVTLMTSCSGKELSNWPCVDCGGEKLDILRDTRVDKTVRKLGMVVSWSFGQGDEKKHKLKEPRGIAINTNQQFIVADQGDKKVKLFENSGKFLDSLQLPIIGLTKEVHIYDVATDNNGNIYVLVELINRVVSDPEIDYRQCGALYVIENTAKGYRYREEFLLIEGVRYCSLTVTSSNKVLVSGSLELSSSRKHVDLYNTRGQFVRSFGNGKLKNALNITATNDGRVMVVNGEDHGSFLQVFSEEGEHLSVFHLKGSCKYPKIAFHQPSKQVVVATDGNLFIYTEDGEFVRSIEHDGKEIQGIAVIEDLVAVACSNYKVLIVALIF